MKRWTVVIYETCLAVSKPIFPNQPWNQSILHAVNQMSNWPLRVRHLAVTHSKVEPEQAHFQSRIGSLGAKLARVNVQQLEQEALGGT